MNALVETRRRYAEALRQQSGVQSPAVVRAFAAVARERYVGPGPWHVIQENRLAAGYRPTPDADPIHLYGDLIVALDRERFINNGAPSLLARLIDALALREGEHVVHVGCGTGYYTAILAAIVGPSGRVTAIEIDADLAAAARRNLAQLDQVEVVHADGGVYDPGPANGILVNVGDTHPHGVWLEALGLGGTLILPLTSRMTDTGPPVTIGNVYSVRRAVRGFLVTLLSPIMIIAAGGRDSRAEQRLAASYSRGGHDRLRSLRRDVHAPDASCWLHGPDFCLSQQEHPANLAS